MEFFSSAETDKVPLFDGTEYWVELKRELNAGEDRQIAHAALRRATRSVNKDGDLSDDLQFDLDLDYAAFAKVALFLVDWNLTDKTGKTIDITKSRKAKLDALRALTPETFKAIEAAVDAHQEARTNEKKAPSGSTGSNRPSVN